MADEPTIYPCPICEAEMSVKPFERGIGWKYECRGSEENPHTVQLYIRTQFPENSRVAVVKPPKPIEVHVSKIGEHTESLLERVKRLSGKGE